MKINTVNTDSYTGLIKKPQTKEETGVKDQVVLGGNTLDPAVTLTEKLKNFKAGDATSEILEAGCMAGATLAGGAIGGGLGVIAGGVGAGFVAAALGAGGWGVFGAVVGGVALGGFLGAKIGAHSVTNDFNK